MQSTCHACKFLIVESDESCPVFKVYRCWHLPRHMILGVSAPYYGEEEEEEDSEDPEPVTRRCYRSKVKLGIW